MHPIVKQIARRSYWYWIALAVGPFVLLLISFMANGLQSEIKHDRMAICTLETQAAVPLSDFCERPS